MMDSPHRFEISGRNAIRACCLSWVDGKYILKERGVVQTGRDPIDMMYG